MESESARCRDEDDASPCQQRKIGAPKTSYADLPLTPQECRQIESETAASCGAAERIALFRASRLPYREAFAQQKLAPIPERLMKEIDQMERAHTARSAKTIADGADEKHKGQWSRPAQVRSRPRVAPAWLSVALLDGALCCFALLQFAPGIESGMDSVRATIVSIAPGASPWIQAAASYQQLYARETLEQIPVDESTSAKTVETIRHEDGLALRVPDLHEAGLVFKRVQRLRFHDRPLVQIVYLPNKGAPVALCVINDAKPDQDVTSQRLDNLNVVAWRRAGMGYALIASNNDVDLALLGKRISDNSVDQLFGGLNTKLPSTPLG
jgi:anti-sigma factor RsiW